MTAAPSPAGLVFDELRHAYTWHGLPVPGVTSCLKILGDYDNVPLDILEAAAARGKAVHRAIELDILGDLDDSELHPEIASRLEQWREFCRVWPFKPIKSEQRVYSERYGYAGTLDVWGIGRGQPMVLDAKATAYVPKQAHAQLAAYTQALQETMRCGPAQRAIIHLRPTKWQVVACTDPADLQVFLACLTLKRWNDAHAINLPKFTD